MGHLADGVWDSNPVFPTSKDGAFKRAAMQFRNWITAEGSPGPTGVGGFAAESGRYHLYVSYACPWAHRTLIFRALKGLTEHITVDAVHPDMLNDGWTFETDEHGATGDSLFGNTYLREVYQQAKPDLTARVTVPILWDKQTGSIVSNESSEIIRMLNSAFDGLTGNDLDFWPEALRAEIEAVNTRVYNTLNNGVYRCGFATTQAAYDTAVRELFDTMDWLEARLSTRRYLVG
ncbi:MAG: glutathione S-transferase family protein, partial [Pseudomonadota bacterium]